MTATPTLEFADFAAWLRANAERKFRRNHACYCPVAEWLMTMYPYARVLTAQWWRSEPGPYQVRLPKQFERFVEAFDGGASALDALAEAER